MFKMKKNYISVITYGKKIMVRLCPNCFEGKGDLSALRGLKGQIWGYRVKKYLRLMKFMHVF